jgi:hypothetical protein
MQGLSPTACRESDPNENFGRRESAHRQNAIGKNLDGRHRPRRRRVRTLARIHANKKRESVELDLEVDDLAPVKENACDAIAECGELCSFVGKHDEKRWGWLALDREARGIVGAYIGDGSAESAKESWFSCLKITEIAPSLTPIFGRHTYPPSRKIGAAPSEKTAAKPIMSKDSTARSASGFPD